MVVKLKYLKILKNNCELYQNLAKIRDISIFTISMSQETFQFPYLKA